MGYLKTPITYYGGKQKLLSFILPLIPEHTSYVEPFFGGGAVFWAKEPSKLEIINDTNRELINFYEVVQNDFAALEKTIRISLYSRAMHNDASVIYNNTQMFSRVERAWAVWVLAAQSFAGKFNGGWGYARKHGETTSVKVAKKRDGFTDELAIRLQNVQIECMDALKVIRSRDFENAFFYCDPPYFNTACGHYNGYGQDDFRALLETLAQIEGKFLLSSYRSAMLDTFTTDHRWHRKTLTKPVLITQGLGLGKRVKIEMLTANYDIPD